MKYRAPCSVCKGVEHERYRRGIYIYKICIVCHRKRMSALLKRWRMNNPEKIKEAREREKIKNISRTRSLKYKIKQESKLRKESKKDI